MRKFFLFALVLTVLAGGYFVLTYDVPSAMAIHKEMKTYEGTVYVAGMGGHFAKAVISIDPASPEPITVKELDRIVIGDKKSHPVHDARVDAANPTVMYWSTYKKDAGGKVHVGKSDLKTGKVITDAALDLDPRATWVDAIYCASGQSKANFIPVTMTDEAYIDVFDKATLKHKHRVFLDSLGYGPKSYKFFHGINSPDMKKFVVAINKVGADGKPSGNIDMVLLDLPALEEGKVKVIKQGKLTGAPGDTLTFRQSFTPDGKYLLQSGADRFYVLDGNTLDLVDERPIPEGQNHDAISTPDGKYAVITLRVPAVSKADPEGKSATDGAIQLYDIAGKRLLGKPVSTCFGCHEKMSIAGNATLCGADAAWK
jgi:hypothetical protein